jgi:hypothetical protein
MPKMTINPLFQYGNIVYHLTDPEQAKGIVVGYEVHPKGLKYIVSFNGNAEGFYAFELTDTLGDITAKKEEESEEDDE